jgi:PAS domain S-box-containing protein
MERMTFEALFEHSSLGIIIADESGAMVLSNPWASRMFGYTKEELLGQKVEMLVPTHIRERHVHHRTAYARDPHPRAMGSNINLLAVKKNGDSFPVEISLTHYEVEGKKFIVSFVNDITVRKEAEQNLLKLTGELESNVRERTKELSDALLELSHTNEGLKQEMEQRRKVEAQIRTMLEKEKELSELKSRFVSMASHEFRTPLAGILTSVSLIDRYANSEDAPKRGKHILNIKKSVRNLTNILNDFLSLDKLDQGKISSASIEFNLTQLIDETIDEFRESTEKGHAFSVSHAAGDLIIFQDKEMIRNVLINLLSNAIKYSPDAGTIFLRTEKAGSNLKIEVEDQGIGIPEEDQKHLFERFFRAKNVTNLQGTGLGLNIVKRYLDLMDGSITFTSKENHGSKFTVTLPEKK